MSLDHVREIADAVLYEGYLLYPYRASSSKNRSRWQFGVLGPPRASAGSYSEDPDMAMQCLLRPRTPAATVSVHLRFLQLQSRAVQRATADGYEAVASLDVDGASMVSWDEAVEREITLPRITLDQPVDVPVQCPGGTDVEFVSDGSGVTVGRIERHRSRLTARVRVGTEVDDGFYRLSVSVHNEHPEPVSGKDAAIRVSLIGAHVLLEAHDAAFVSLLEPPDEAVAAAARCHQRRCFPVLVGDPGSPNVVLGAPIILYDYPEIAEQSPGALFDSTEIDEILTLRVMTMTDDEKAEARATDPRARAVVDRCENMPPAALAQLHGVLRDPHAESQGAPQRPVDGAADSRTAEPPGFDTGDVPWWEPEADGSVRPDVDAVTIDGVRVARGSTVRVHPSRRADAQDLFFADQLARVTAVLSDVDGNVHVALVLADDPAIDLHEWYGRYFYFAPDELEPVVAEATADVREESRS